MDLEEEETAAAAVVVPELPIDVVRQIALHQESYTARLRLGQVCQSWRQLIQKDASLHEVVHLQGVVLTDELVTYIQDMKRCRRLLFSGLRVRRNAQGRMRPNPLTLLSPRVHAISFHDCDFISSQFIIDLHQQVVINEVGLRQLQLTGLRQNEENLIIAIPFLQKLVFEDNQVLGNFKILSQELEHVSLAHNSLRSIWTTSSEFGDRGRNLMLFGGSVRTLDLSDNDFRGAEELITPEEIMAKLDELLGNFERLEKVILRGFRTLRRAERTSGLDLRRFESLRTVDARDLGEEIEFIMLPSALRFADLRGNPHLLSVEAQPRTLVLR